MRGGARLRWQARSHAETRPRPSGSRSPARRVPQHPDLLVMRPWPRSSSSSPCPWGVAGPLVPHRSPGLAHGAATKAVMEQGQWNRFLLPGPSSEASFPARVGELQTCWQRLSLARLLSGAEGWALTSGGRGLDGATAASCISPSLPRWAAVLLSLPWPRRTPREPPISEPPRGTGQLK